MKVTRLFSLILAIAMVFSLVAIPVSATTPEEDAEERMAFSASVIMVALLTIAGVALVCVPFVIIAVIVIVVITAKKKKATAANESESVEDKTSEEQR